MKLNGFRLLAGPVLAATLALPLAGSGCSAAKAAEGCNGLDVNAQADVTVKAFADAATQLDDAATKVEAQWATVCNAINGDLGEDTSKTDAAGACGVLNARVAKALQNGATVNVTAHYTCQADASVQADCQGKCAAAAKCDIQASCTPAQLSGTCSGSCTGSCTAPSVSCTGQCTGTCTASGGISCSGTCDGSCTAPTWTGTCDAGCSASFNGTCGGNCTGTCDGNNVSGTKCNGTCVGTCSANATGSCKAQCTGTFSGGTCSAQCTGKCTSDAAVNCQGTCDGTCSATPAKCSGQCKGGCSVKYTAPHCDGQLSCKGTANCQASCNGQASASVKCGGSTDVQVTGDAALYAALEAHSSEIAAAFGATVDLKTQIGTLIKTVGPAIQGVGNISAAGVTCMASSLKVMGQAQASINVSVNASASVNGKASSG